MTAVSRFPSLAFLCLLLIWNPVAAAADWSSWRGPHQDGRVLAALPDGSIDLDVAWQRELGSGYSAVSVIGDRVLTMYGDGTDDVLVALSLDDGEELWRYRLGPMTPGGNGSHAGPLSTPVSDGETVFATGSDAKIFAVSLADGKERWTVSLQEAVEAAVPHFGFTSSPVVADDSVIVQAGGPEAGVVALDRNTGEMRWKAGEGSVDYRSPVFATLAGTKQIIAPFKDKTFGLHPSTGEVLWSLDYETNGSVTPLVIGEDRLLLTGGDGAVLFQMNGVQMDDTPKQIWKNADFKRSFATPVLIGDTLYGFNRSFLTAVDIETGERRWRSRPPGGRGLIALDNRLAIFDGSGRLVLIDPADGDYSEAGHVALAEAGSYTPPSYAGGLIFARDLERVTAIRPQASTAKADTADAAPTNQFEAFLRGLARNSGKSEQIEKFLAAQKSFPIVEDDLLHFVYHGKAEDVALRASMLDFGREVAMHRAPETDFFHYTVEVPAGSRWEYQFIVDFENTVTDPRNSRTVPGNNGSGELSEIDLTGREQPGFLAAYEGDKPGRTESFAFESEILGNSREITVYLPHGYDDSSDDYPVVLFQQGKQWLDGAAPINTLNHVAGSQIAPTVAVFVEMPRRASRNELLGRSAAEYVRMLSDELAGVLHEKYRLEKTWIVAGKGDGGGSALYAALQRPDVFDRAVVFSYSEPSRLIDAMTERMKNSKDGDRARFEVHWNRDDFKSRAEDWDIPKETRALAQALRDHGFDVGGGEHVDGGGWGSWRSLIVPALQAYLPAD